MRTRSIAVAPLLFLLSCVAPDDFGDVEADEASSVRSCDLKVCEPPSCLSLVYVRPNPESPFGIPLPALRSVAIDATECVQNHNVVFDFHPTHGGVDLDSFGAKVVAEAGTCTILGGWLSGAETTVEMGSPGDIWEGLIVDMDADGVLSWTYVFPDLLGAEYLADMGDPPALDERTLVYQDGSWHLGKPGWTAYCE